MQATLRNGSLLLDCFDVLLRRAMHHQAYLTKAKREISDEAARRSIRWQLL